MEFKRFIYKFLGLVYPEKCACCGRVITPDSLVCEYCIDALPYINEPICTDCGIEKTNCTCNNRKNSYNSLIAPFYYKGVIARSIRDFKFGSKKYIYRFLANEMANCVNNKYDEDVFDFICCVPMTKQKISQRGYNQSELLAREIGTTLGIRYVDALEKLYEIPEQHSLNAQQRKGNVIGVFEAKEDVDFQDANILLCDDIKTTGATLEECTKILLLAGAKQVKCVTAAITFNDKNEN
ncbi:MAG: double zinc ribbon domain-containing protein [Clostridiales bacterium]|nr:double zinc ribbon domain-containing protein [Clostridiales bacterium]